MLKLKRGVLVLGLQFEKTMDEIEQKKATQVMFQSIATEFTRPLDLIALNCEYVSMHIKSNQSNYSAEKVMDSLHDIQNSTTHLNRLLDNYIAVSESLNGSLQPQMRKIDLSSILGSVCLDSEEIYKLIGVRLSYEIPKDMETFVYADRAFVERVCLNLLSNSLQACPSGGNVQFKLKKGKTNHVLTIQDDGVGFAQENIAKAFDLFSGKRVTPTKNSFYGAGIGLYLCSEYCRIMGWDINIKSLKKGTQIIISIPVVEVNIENEIVFCSNDAIDVALDQVTRVNVLKELRCVPGLERLGRID